MVPTVNNNSPDTSPGASPDPARIPETDKPPSFFSGGVMACLLLTVGMIGFFVIEISVLPRFVRIYEELGAEIPALLQIMVDLSARVIMMHPIGMGAMVVAFVALGLTWVLNLAAPVRDRQITSVVTWMAAVFLLLLDAGMIALLYLPLSNLAITIR